MAAYQRHLDSMAEISDQVRPTMNTAALSDPLNTVPPRAPPRAANAPISAPAARRLAQTAEHAMSSARVHEVFSTRATTRASTTANLDHVHANAAANLSVASTDGQPHLASNLPGPSVSRPGAAPHGPAASTATPTPQMLAERPSPRVPQAAADVYFARSHARQAGPLETDALRMPQATGRCFHL